MDKDVLIKQLTSQKIKDYTYGVIFFFTFSFFLFFVIRPNIVNVLSLQEELGKLRLLDTNYESVIKKIINIQTFLETNRSDLFLLDQAISVTPQINKLVQDVENAANESGVIITQVNMNKIDLKESIKKKTKNTLTISMVTNANFESTRSFIRNITQQRRLKSFKNITLEKDEKEGSSSAALKIILELDGYYL